LKIDKFATALCKDTNLSFCSREELQLVSNNGLEDSKVQKYKFVSLREAVGNLSIFN